MQSEREPTEDAAVPPTANNGSPIRMYYKNWMPDGGTAICFPEATQGTACNPMWPKVLWVRSVFTASVPVANYLPVPLLHLLHHTPSHSCRFK